MRNAQDADVLEVETTETSTNPLRRSLPVALAVVSVDQITKWWALSALESVSCTQPGACIELFAGIRFHLVFNTGAAFTRGSGYGPVLAVLAFVMAGVLLYLSTKRTDRWGAVLLGAIAGGAVGNLIDRVFRAEDGALSGAVVDFIDLGWWPVFNIADSAIVVGVVTMLAMAFFERPAETKPGPVSVDTEPETVDTGSRAVNTRPESVSSD